MENNQTNWGSLSLVSAFVDAYSQEGVTGALHAMGKRLAVLAVPLGEVAVVLAIIAIAAAAKRSGQAKKHELVLSGIASPSREPPRCIMAPHFFQNKQGLWLHHGMYWNEKAGIQARGVIILLHGHSEHHKRFIHVAERLNEQGFVVFGMDHQGFGRSEGDRGHVESFDHYPEDVLEFMKVVVYDQHPEYRELPRFLVAHSMGGLIAIHSALRCKVSTHPAHKLAGAMLSAPALFVDPERNSPALRIVGRIIDTLWPKAQLVSFPAYPSTSFLQLKAHASTDPLNYHGNVRVHQGLELLRGTAEAIEHAPSFDLPVLIFHGTLDLHASVNGSKKFISTCVSEDKLLLELPELQHEPWQEEENIREPILDVMLAWATDRLPGAGAPQLEKKLRKLTVQYVKHPEAADSGSEGGFEKL